MFEKLIKLNMQYFEEHHSADVLKRLIQDANLLKEKLMEEKIVILVTHRTSSFANFDRVIPIKDEIVLDV